MQDDNQAELKSVSGADRRRFFRVEDNAAIKYRAITDAEKELLAKEILNGSIKTESLVGAFSATTQQMDHLLRNFRSREPDIAAYLEILNEKLDIMARSFFMEESELATRSKLEVNISASGISFDAETELEMGEFVELYILAFPSLIHIHTIAKVTRSENINTADHGPLYAIALDFEVISKEDEELLIQHVVQKESDHLRKRREDEE